MGLYGNLAEIRNIEEKEESISVKISITLETP